MSQKDTLFSKPLSKLHDWRFDENVANVFSDMAQRSIPGYATIIELIGRFSMRFIQDNSNVYDLGCSLGESTLSILHQTKNKAFTIFSIDNSQAMVESCQVRLGQFDLKKQNAQLNYEIICDDICKIPIENASFVVLNFTLQFIPKQERMALIQRIYDGLKPGGALILSEKYHFTNKLINELQTEMYYDFKRANGYSELEINQKRIMLENVMQTDSIDVHLERLEHAGFDSVSTWYQCLNFGSMIALKKS